MTDINKIAREVIELEEENLAQSEKLRNLNTAMDTLIYQNAVTREALEAYDTWANIPADRGGEHGKRGQAYARFLKLKDKALSLTPSDAAEMVSRKDELIASLGGFLQTFRNRAHEDRDGYIFAITAKKGFIDELDKAIEAARSAGVEVKDVAL